MDEGIVADGESKSLDPRYVQLARQTGWIAAAVTAAVSLVGLALLLLTADDLPRWWRWMLPGAVLAGLGGFTWWLLRWPAIEYRHISYRVDANGLEIRRGVYFRSVTNVPRSRVQHTDVAQGPLQRKYGLATLIMHTAGTANAEVEVPGLAHETALLIRDHLLPRNTTDAI